MGKEKTMELIQKEVKFYLSTPERAAEALLFIRDLENYAKEIKAKVKERAVEIMDREERETIEYSVLDEKTGEVREWLVRRSYGRETKEYKPENVLAALGVVDGVKFLKVGKTKLENYLKRASAKNEITMEVVGAATADPTIKMIKGSGVMIREIKPQK